MLDIRRAFERLVDALNQLGIPYMVGGSLASSLHGIFRSTNDIDIVARIREADVPGLEAKLAGEFYLDPDTVREALRHSRSFNLIHYETSYKFDIFPVADDPYSQIQLARAAVQEVTLAQGELMKCSVATPEDTILSKLVWYRAGGEQSERQWSDLRAVCAVQGARLDRTYMRKWARHLGVEDLLERLLVEQGLA